MNKKIALGAVAAAVLVSSIYASPYWTVYKMRQAIVAHDAAAFSERVDFPALRESINTQLTAKMAEKAKQQPAENNPFAALGGALALALVQKFVEAMVTPSGVMLMLDSAATGPSAVMAEKNQPAADAGSSTAEQKQPAQYALSYQNWSTVKAQSKSADASAGSFIFKRAGLWSWKLAGLELPAN